MCIRDSINIGRLTKQKDHITLLKAMKIVLKKVQCNLIIIGEGSERDNIYKFIQDNNLESNVNLFFPFIFFLSCLIKSIILIIPCLEN